jgi:S-formylglutathione hydrolase FrmB
MRNVWLALVLVACGGARASAPVVAEPAPPPPERAVARGPGTVITETLSSQVLGVDKEVVVYLPGGYAESKHRYPVIYLMHGLTGNQTDWVRLGGLVEAADAMNLAAIVVMPDGDASFYVNGVTPPDHEACLKGEGIFAKQTPESYCTRSARYEDHMTRELVAWVDGKFRTVARREGRALSGLSMGGYGALTLGMRHPDLYSSLASHSGMAALLYAGPWPYEAGKARLTDDVARWGADLGETGALIRSIFGPDVENWRAHDPVLLAGKITPGELAFYLDSGDADEFGLDAGARYLADLLRAGGHEVELTIVAGAKHDWVIWKDRIDESLAFHARQFARAGL